MIVEEIDVSCRAERIASLFPMRRVQPRGRAATTGSIGVRCNLGNCLGRPVTHHSENTRRAPASTDNERRDMGNACRPFGA